MFESVIAEMVEEGLGDQNKKLMKHIAESKVEGDTVMDHGIFG